MEDQKDEKIKLTLAQKLTAAEKRISELEKDVNEIKRYLSYQQGIKEFKSVLFPIAYDEKYEVNCTVPMGEYKKE